MQPLKPDEKTKILAQRPEAAPQDVEEYEKLLSQRFAIDPNVAAATAQKPLPAPDPMEPERRLKELHSKLFGGK